MQKCQEEFEGDFHPFYKNCRVGGEGRQFTNTGIIALNFPTLLTSILHLHHNLAKAAYHAKNYINLVELLISDKADLITILVHFCYLRDWQTNSAGLTGSLGTAGTASLGNPFGTTTGLGGTSLTSGSTFGTPLGTNTLGTTGLGATTGFGTPSLTGGFGTPTLGSSAGGAFASTGTGLGGTGFGTGTSAFTAQPKFQLPDKELKQLRRLQKKQ